MRRVVSTKSGAASARVKAVQIMARYPRAWRVRVDPFIYAPRATRDLFRWGGPRLRRLLALATLRIARGDWPGMQGLRWRTKGGTPWTSFVSRVWALRWWMRREEDQEWWWVTTSRDWDERQWSALRIPLFAIACPRSFDEIKRRILRDAESAMRYSASKRGVTLWLEYGYPLTGKRGLLSSDWERVAERYGWSETVAALYASTWEIVPWVRPEPVSTPISRQMQLPI